MKLDAIYEPIADELQEVGRGLLGRLERLIGRQGILSSLADLPLESVTHLFAAPGKLLRPALVLLSARAAGGAARLDARSLVDLATAVELVHTASLVHDDIIDCADSRRDLESVNRRFGSAVAVLAGDVLYAESFVTLLELPGVEWREREELLRRFADTTQRMCFGEMRERRIVERGEAASIDEYLDVVERKTAELMSLSCAVGAIVCGAPPQTVDRLACFGRLFGMAFQLVDDALDGDAPVIPAWNSVGRAEAYVRQALESAAGLGQSEGALKLRELCGYVMDRAKAGVDRL